MEHGTGAERAGEIVRTGPWLHVYEDLSGRDPVSLGPVELEVLAEAAWWLCKTDESVAARQRAYAVFRDDKLQGPGAGPARQPGQQAASQTVSGSAATSTSPVANDGALASACTGSSCLGQPAASWRSASDDLVQAGMGAVLDGRGRRPELGLADGGLECLGTLVAADVDEPEVGLGRQAAV